MNPRALNRKATRIIRNCYTNGAIDPDPHKVLTDIARSVTVIGNLLQGLSDRYGKIGEKPARWIAAAGRLFWGIVEVSVPNSVLGYFGRNWIWLIALIGLAMLVLGFIVAVPPVTGIGAGMLAAAFLLYQIRAALNRFMTTTRIPWFIFWSTLAISGTAIVLVASAYIAHEHGSWIADKLLWLAPKFRWAAKADWKEMLRLAWNGMKSSLRGKQHQALIPSPLRLVSIRR